MPGQFPQLGLDADAAVEAILTRRTFWEKVTILYAGYHRPAGKPFPSRYSHQYYDVAMLAKVPSKLKRWRIMGRLCAQGAGLPNPKRCREPAIVAARADAGASETRRRNPG